MSSLAWPGERVPLEPVLEWIASVLPGRPRVSGPTTVYRTNDWGATARFTAGNEEYVLKVNYLPLEFPGAVNYALLQRCIPAHVPDLVAWVEEPGRRWQLFRPFEGDVVKTLGSAEAVQAMARTTALIQTAAADADQTGTLRLAAEQVPALLEEITPILPPELSAQVERFRPHLSAWANELAKGPWRYSIDHADLHTNNAIRRSDGGVLIYDWEEAIISCPFFSLDKLMAYSEELQAAAAVREAYLDAIPWGTRPERERAFDLALALSPIRYTWADKRFAEAVGWGLDPVREVAAWWLGRALPRWERLVSTPEA